MADTSLGNQGLYNLYGLVIDATRITTNNKGQHAVYIKICDPTMFYNDEEDLSIQMGSTAAARRFQSNLNDSNPNNYAVSIALYSSKPEKLPIINHVGDIIRIHRANIGRYQANGKTFKTFYVNIDYGSNWLLFRGPQLLPTPKAKEHVRNEIEEGFDTPLVKPYMYSKEGFSLTADDN